MGCTVVGNNKAGASSSSFEACFADGLDLSEFDATATNTGSSSHAAALLRQKQTESIEKEKHAQQETRLLEAVQERQRTSNESTIKKREYDSTRSATAFLRHHGSSTNDVAGPTSSRSRPWISSVVVGMHNAETKEEPRHKMMRGRALKKEQTRRKSASTTMSGGKGTKILPAGNKKRQQQAMRTPRRSKY